MATVRHLVVVASAEPATTDSLADLLRDTFTVRTAYSASEVVDRLDPDVDVVLVDRELETGDEAAGEGPDPVDAVRDAVSAEDLNCQIGLLGAATADDTGADAVVSPTMSDRAVRDEVVQLATRARYRKTLDQFYELARTTAQLRGSADVQAERDRLEQRLDRLGRRLDEAAEPLDTATLFETVLDPDSTSDGAPDPHTGPASDRGPASDSGRNPDRDA